MTSGGRVPVVWAANKQDAAPATPREDLHERLGLPRDVPVLPCVATDAVQARRILDALLSRILAAPTETT